MLSTVTRRRSHDVVVAGTTAATVFQQLPAAALVMDASGAVVLRNHAGEALAAEVSAVHGPEVLAHLRAVLGTVVREETVFPVSRTIVDEHGGAGWEFEAEVDQVPGGVVVVWRDVSRLREAQRATAGVARELAVSATSLTDIGAEIGSATDEVSALAATVAAGAEQMTASIREIAVGASAASEGAASAVVAAGTATTRLGDLAASTARIGAVIKIITAIAEQTHLLALNATIEAARAGEAGKGFAVVAGEVKGLASRTREATNEITEMISAIQEASESAAGAIGEILRVIDGVQAQQSSVAGSVEEQTAVTQDLSSSIAAVADAAAAAAAALGGLRDSAGSVAAQAVALDAIVTR